MLMVMMMMMSTLLTVGHIVVKDSPNLDTSFGAAEINRWYGKFSMDPVYGLEAYYGKDLTSTVSQVTGIAMRYLRKGEASINDASVARKMSWAGQPADNKSRRYGLLPSGHL